MEDKKKLGVEDLVQAQRETAEQLKIIAERLDWICDAEHQPYNYGCGWIWWSVMILALLLAGGAGANGRSEALLGIIAICMVVLVGFSLRDSSKTARQQMADRWDYQQRLKSDKDHFSKQQKELEEHKARKDEARRQNVVASKPKIEIKKD